jgi:hypothetical protein
VNQFEMMGCLGGLGGLFAGALVGHRIGGGLGGAIGGAIGAVAGGIAGWSFVSLSFGLSIAAERRRKRAGLVKRFGPYWDEGHAVAWDEACQRVRAGETVRGEVVFVFYYGAFVDIGCGFPALLKTVEMIWPDPQTAPKLPEVGQTVEARVKSFDVKDREVVLTLR